MIRFFIFLVSILVVFSNYLVYKSNKHQVVLLNDAKSNQYSLSKNQLAEINYKYPSLTINSVPTLTYISRYNTNNNDYDIAIKQLKESLSSNPNSIYTKYLLSRNFIYKNDFQNAEKFLQQIFDESPNIESSTVLYLSVLEKNENKIKLYNIFDIMTKLENKNIWSYYLSAIKNNTNIPSDSLLFNKTLLFFQNKF